MDNTLEGTNVEFNKNTKQKIIKINSGYFWVPPRKIPAGTPEQKRLFQSVRTEVFGNSEYCFEQQPKSLNEQRSHSSN
jgi:hypothetical protein